MTEKSPPRGELVPLEILTPAAPTQPATSERPFRGRRERANALRERMARFSAIYNAGWTVRNAYFGPDQQQREAVMKLLAVLLQELRATKDYEALLFALADALHCGSHGVPWEA